MTTESLNDSAAPSNGGDQAPTSAPALDTVLTQQPPADAQPAAPAAPKAEDAAPPADAPKADDVPKADPAPEVISYDDLALPEGLEPTDPMLVDLKAIAAEAKLPKETAQQLVELGHKAVQSVLDEQIALIQKQADTWEQEIKSDPEFGGDNLPKNLAVAAKAVETFATPEIKAMLNRFDPKENPHGMGLGNHPAVVKFFHQIGLRLSEDGFVGGEGPGTQKDAAQILYNNTKTK